MAKKSKKIEKETRRLMEGITDLIKKKGDRYKFKSKNKKVIKKVKRTCVHWIYRKGKEVATVVPHPERQGYWKCKICNAEFPVKPIESSKEGNGNGYQQATDQFLGLVNQMQFWSVKLGGDADDTKMFIKLKELLPRFAKVSKQILKNVNKREEMDKNRSKTGAMSQFDSYAGYSYRD